MYNEERVCQILEELKAAVAELNYSVYKHLSEHGDDEDVQAVAEVLSRFKLPDNLMSD